MFVFLAFSSCFYNDNFALALLDQGNPAALNLQAANNAIEQAFGAVLDAEKAGANVTALLDQLNSAANLLAQAENSNRTGDFNTTAIIVDSVIPITQQVTVSAQSSRQAALVYSKDAFGFSIALTAISVFIFILTLFLIWRRLKQNFMKSLSQTKP